MCCLWSPSKMQKMVALVQLVAVLAMKAVGKWLRSNAGIHVTQVNTNKLDKVTYVLLTLYILLPLSTLSSLNATISLKGKSPKP